MSAPSDQQVQRDNYQAFDDTCFQRSVTEAMELMGWVSGSEAPAAAVNLFKRMYPGVDPNTQGTYMSDALTGLKLATGVDGEWVYGADDVMAALAKGQFCILGEHDLMGDGENHFLLFLPGRGDSPAGIHCIDSDEALDADPDVWPLATVVAAGVALMGPGQPIGITFALEDRTVATPSEPSTPDLMDAKIQQLAAITDQIERQAALVTEGFRRIREGQFAGATGLDAVIVALQGGTPLDFAPTFP